MSEFTISVDIAKKRDFTAIQIYRATPELIRGDERVNAKDRSFLYQDLVYQFKTQDQSYEDLACHLVRLVNSKKLENNNDLLVDGTGVGVAVVDVLRNKGLSPIPIVATGNGKARPIYEEADKIFNFMSPNGSCFRGLQTVSEWHVPKVELVQAGQIAMEQGLVRLAGNLEHVDDFKEQLMNFKGKFNEKTRYTAYNAEDDDIHDDFITCFLMAMWWVREKKENEMAQNTSNEPDADFNPMDRW